MLSGLSLSHTHTMLHAVYVFMGDRGALLDFAMLLHEEATGGGSGGGGGDGASAEAAVDPDSEYAVLAADTAVDLGEESGDCQKYVVPAWNWQWSETAADLARVHRAFRAVVMVLPAHIDVRLNQTYGCVPSVVTI